MSLTRAHSTKIIRLVTLLLFLAVLAWFNNSPSETVAATEPSGPYLVGRVVAVADGDTVTVLDAHQQQHRIRLVGIDAPENRQAFGRQSGELLRSWIHGQEVRVEHTKTDRYNRILGKIWFEDRDINLAMVEAGMAWYYRHFARDLDPADRERYDQAEAQAREQRLGLWADPNPQAPWDFRRQRR